MKISRRLQNIKKKKDRYLTRFVFKHIELLKAKLNLNTNARLYFLDFLGNTHIFLYNNQIIVSAWECKKTPNEQINEQTMFLCSLYIITPLVDYPKTKEDIKFETIIENSEYKYFENDFLNWIDKPSSINEQIDLPFYKIIKFLQQYKKTTFSTKRYSFYSKKDNEYCYTFNLYAKDKKTNKEIKLYIPNKWGKNKRKEYVLSIPQNTNDIIAFDKSEEFSQYQKYEIKKAFIELANQECVELETSNFFAMELIKQAIQPIEKDRAWCVHRIFAGDSKFKNIWVCDFPRIDEEPYFFIADSNFLWQTTKIATINLKTPTYHTKGIFKDGLVKCKGWELQREYIKELMDFLSSDYKQKEYEKTPFKIETNWQKLIYEYNWNTAGWDVDHPNGIDEEIEVLPFDLKMPNYIELVKDKWIFEQNEELGSLTKKMLKPENFIGPFDSTEEMIKSLWED